jgi:histidinol-phosphate/aromatic aminotransferase/cobyric acid decarboxylase-like protein
VADGGPAALAVAAWRTPPGVRLDLRYSPDEDEWLDPHPAAVWRDVMAAAGDVGAGAAGRYPVDDPYGGERAAPVVASAFGVALAADQVTFGAGITGLLHGLAGLVRGRRLLVGALAHPDLAVWARARGADVDVDPGLASVEALTAAADHAVVQLDRPAFGGEVAPAAAIAALAARAAVVVVDEAGANYLPPAASAVRLVPRTANLVVLRGFTKAYSLGGMRAGFAVASLGVAADVRAVLAPMQVSEPALQVALRLLAAGDPCARLRERIHAVRPAAVSALSAAGLRVQAGHPDVPAVVVDDADGAAWRELERRGIRGLAPPVPDAGLLQS